MGPKDTFTFRALYEKAPALESIWGFPKIGGYLFGDPHNKDCSILGSIVGSPYSGKLPFGCPARLSWIAEVSPGTIPLEIAPDHRRPVATSDGEGAPLNYLAMAFTQMEV